MYPRGLLLDRCDIAFAMPFLAIRKKHFDGVHNACCRAEADRAERSTETRLKSIEATLPSIESLLWE